MNSSSFRFPAVRSIAAAVVLSALSLAWLSGCVVVAASAAGAGAVAWVRGELNSTVDHGLDDTYRATESALRKLEFAKISAVKSAVDAELVSRTALDKKIEVKLERVGDKLTKIHIRVGVIGDEALSLTILEKIKAEL